MNANRTAGHTGPGLIGCITSNGQTIVDEKCKCGHSIKTHADTGLRGHGTCNVCACGHYRWKDFVTKRV